MSTFFQWSLCLVVGIMLAIVMLSTSVYAATCDQNSLTQVAYGQSSAAVTNVQQCLIDAGYDIPAGATSYYGSQTQAAVKAFYRQQLSMGDWHGNSVGPQGIANLTDVSSGLPPTQPPVTPLVANTCGSDTLSAATYGVSNAQVTQLQECLLDAGFDIPAGATGYYGGQTQSAVQAFYRAQLGMSDWHGRWVGPQGRAILATAVPTPTPNPTPTPTPSPTPGTSSAASSDYFYKRVSSADELAEYLDVSSGYYGQTLTTAASLDGSVGFSDDAAFGAPMAAESNEQSSSRVSTTNVQVAGIDEPDIVKTDGENIYVSTRSYWYAEPMPLTTEEVAVDAIAPYPYERPTTKVVGAFPPADLAVISEDDIEVTGEMLLVDDQLLVFTHDRVVAYDVRNPDTPTKDWEKSYGERTSLVTARLMDEVVYLVTATSLRRDRPCPPVPLLDAGMRLPCTSVWVPERLERLNTSFTVLSLDPRTGDVDDSLTVAGESNNTVVAMFPNNIYLTQRQTTSETEVLLDFFEFEIPDLLSAETIARIHTVRGYDISEQSKVTEVSNILEEAMNTMTDDEMLRFETEAQNRLADYVQERMRDMDRTAVTRISVDTLSISETKSVPGHLLNQFALDEHEGHLRMAVTVGDRWRTGNTANDVYVLDRNLEIVGSVTDLGLTEQIFSVRFIGDRGYVVTFRQIDPFYVLDLSEPDDPKMVGELKIPGFSSYLEAIDDDTVLGVGRDGSNVKLSLFDVSNTSRPIESDTFTLKEHWSEVNSNHRAFLRDPKYGVVFIPAGQGGYVISYTNSELALEAAVAGYAVRRAVFIDDYLYVVGENDITVLDEVTWEEVGTLELGDNAPPIDYGDDPML